MVVFSQMIKDSIDYQLLSHIKDRERKTKKEVINKTTLRKQNRMLSLPLDDSPTWDWSYSRFPPVERKDSTAGAGKTFGISDVNPPIINSCLIVFMQVGVGGVGVKSWRTMFLLLSSGLPQTRCVPWLLTPEPTLVPQTPLWGREDQTKGARLTCGSSCCTPVHH